MPQNGNLIILFFKKMLIPFRKKKILKISIDFKRYSDNACVPLREIAGSAGYNLYSAEDKMINSLVES